MSNLKFSPARIRSGTGLAAILLLGSTAVAEAQRPVSGFNRSDQTDVAGVIVTGGDQLGPLFAEPGTVRSMSCPVAWGIRTAADDTHALLVSARLNGVSGPGGQVLDAQAQRRVLHALTANGRGSAETDALLGALAPPQNRQATAAARKLVREARGLFDVAQRIDPARPGSASATRLSETVGAYNAFIETSTPEFLASRPAELAALHAVLNHLVIASLENEGRQTDVTAVDARGLACAPSPAAFAPPVAAPPPPREQALEICVISDGRVQYIAVLWRPEVGDSLVIVGGERVPFAEAYPTASRPDWLTLGHPVHVGTTEYRPFGVSRIVAPGEVARAGEISGMDYFVEPGERRPPSIIYFPVGSDCELQPYRSVETIRVRG